MIQTKANKKFDIDLKYGQVREKQVSNIFANKKIEIKTERDWWEKTGNIALEYECNGKPSGINATESDYWIQILAKGNKNHCMLVFEVKELKKIIPYAHVWHVKKILKVKEFIIEFVIYVKVQKNGKWVMIIL